MKNVPENNSENCFKMNMSSFLMNLMLLCQCVSNALLALFHQPFGGGGGTAYTDGKLLVLSQGILEGLQGIDFSRTIYHIGLCVRAGTLLKECPPIAALSSANEQNDVVVAGKIADMGNTVGYLSADGVGKGESSRGRYVCLNILHDLPEAF